MGRIERITKLIEDDINTIVEGNEVSYLADILREGFKGYANYTDKELEEEVANRFDHYTT